MHREMHLQERVLHLGHLISDKCRTIYWYHFFPVIPYYRDIFSWFFWHYRWAFVGKVNVVRQEDPLLVNGLFLLDILIQKVSCFLLQRADIKISTKLKKNNNFFKLLCFCFSPNVCFYLCHIHIINLNWLTNLKTQFYIKQNTTNSSLIFDLQLKEKTRGSELCQFLFMNKLYII